MSRETHFPVLFLLIPVNCPQHRARMNTDRRGRDSNMWQKHALWPGPAPGSCVVEDHSSTHHADLRLGVENRRRLGITQLTNAGTGLRVGVACQPHPNSESEFCLVS